MLEDQSTRTFVDIACSSRKVSPDAIFTHVTSTLVLVVLLYFQNDDSSQHVCSCADQPFAAKGPIPPQPNPQYRSYPARSAAGNHEKPKRRRRRPEERKNRGRTGTGGGRRLTSVYPTVRLPPLMPTALGLLPSDHVFLVRAS